MMVVFYIADAIHFASWYDGIPCSTTFPEMATITAQLTLQNAMGRPVTLCH